MTNLITEQLVTPVTQTCDPSGQTNSVVGTHTCSQTFLSAVLAADLFKWDLVCLNSRSVLPQLQTALETV